MKTLNMLILLSITAIGCKTQREYVYIERVQRDTVITVDTVINIKKDTVSLSFICDTITDTVIINQSKRSHLAMYKRGKYIQIKSQCDALRLKISIQRSISKVFERLKHTSVICEEKKLSVFQRYWWLGWLIFTAYLIKNNWRKILLLFINPLIK